MDEDCTQLAQDSYYYAITGSQLPFSESTGIAVTGYSCAPCNGGNQEEEEEEADYGGDDDANEAVTYDLSQCEAIFGSARERDDETTNTVKRKRMCFHIPQGVITVIILGSAVLLVIFGAFTVGSYGVPYFIGDNTTALGSDGAKQHDKAAALLPVPSHQEHEPAPDNQKEREC